MSDDEYDLVEAIDSEVSADLLSRLANYAEKRLGRVGWFTTAKRETHKMSPKELVDVAIGQCLEGERHWYRSSHYSSLEYFLRGVIRSLLSSAVKADGRDKTDLDEQGVVDPPAETPAPDSRILDEARTAIVAAVECCANDDAELSDFYLAVLDGHTKRDDIATALGWDVDRVTAARVKLQRRLEKRHPDLFGDRKKRRSP